MPRPAVTASFKLNHAMLRITNPTASLDFYTNVLGMDVLTEFHGDGSFSVYYLGYEAIGKAPTSRLPIKNRFKAIYSREGVLELVYNPSTGFDEEYADGNPDDIQGYQRHIGITVDDVNAACAHFEEHGVHFERRLNEAIPKNVAFILDPDGHSIEIVPRTFLPLGST